MLHKPAYIQLSDKSKTVITINLVHLSFVKNVFFKSLLDALVTINLIKPAGYVTYQQFNIQQLNALPTLYLCVLYLSENKQRLVPLTA